MYVILLFIVLAILLIESDRTLPTSQTECLSEYRAENLTPNPPQETKTRGPVLSTLRYPGIFQTKGHTT